MSVLELAMLVCFGAAWPFSIYKAYVSKNSSGQSLPFLHVILAGYLAGIGHKLLYNFDKVIYAYVLNALMVIANILIIQRNRTLAAVEVESKDE